MARTAIPLAAYYAVTLGLPLANGAGSGEGFAKHAVIVLLLPLSIVGLIRVAGAVWKAVH